MVLFRFLTSLFVLLIPLHIHAVLINKINISGLETVSRGSVLSYLAIEVNEDLNPDLLPSLKQNLLQKDLFKDISVSIDNNELNINVVENPTIKYFEINGFKDDEVINSEIVEKIILNFNLSAGQVFAPDNLKKLIDNLKFLYQEKAFYNTLINLKQTIDDKNRIGIELNINEGDRALIQSFNIIGNNFYTNKDILDNFNIGLPDFYLMNFFTKKDHFSKKELNAGIQKITNKYLESGFLDFKVSNIEIKHIKEVNKLDMTIFIEEGIQYKIANVQFSGNLLGFSHRKLREQIQLEDNEIFQRKKILQGVSKIQKLYNDLGYLYADVKSSVTTRKNSDKLSITISIEPDSLIFINRINISGNTTTQDDVIRRQLKLNEGEVYSKEAIDESINKIKRLGYFSDVKYEFKRHQLDFDKVDMFIEVTETKTGELSIGLSHSNSTGASITAGISQNNILGTGNTLKASFSNSDALEQTSIYFMNPHINNSKHKISYGVFSKNLDAGNLDASSYILSEGGVNFGYGIPMSSSSEIFSEIIASKVDLTCGVSLRLVEEIAQCSSNDELDLSLSFAYSSNTLNDFYFATDGTKNSLKTIISLPLGDFKYYQIEASHKNYTPIFNNKTFKFSSRLNYGSGYGDKDLPFFKRYYEGGNSSVRGFDFNSLGAKYASTDKPKGGELSLVSSLGIASGLQFLGLANENMRISAFMDAGTISEKSSDFSLNSIRVSSGVEFSWLTPIGPLGLNYAVPLVKESTDKTSSFNFVLGSTF